MIKTGSWETALPNLKKYNIAGEWPPEFRLGKDHRITDLINEIREIFHAMGSTDQGPDC